LPALTKQSGFVYLDSAAATQRPAAVLDALVDFYARTPDEIVGCIQPGRGS
jgi:selenocysteine lyase/cysteine desulfurase